MLSNYRVLDLSDERGILSGKILGDLGADVLAIEPPWGNSARRQGPFYQEVPDPEKSLFWAFFATNKRSVTVNMETSKGKKLLCKLIQKSHFLIESFRPGYMSDLGFSYDDVREINPSIIMVSISPFGQKGPYSKYQATDLTGMALSGIMYLTGDVDRPPVRVSSPQFWSAGGASGAAGAMIANHYRLKTGNGQFVDVSCQQSIARALSHAPQIWDLEKYNMTRQGPYRPVGQVNLRINWECADGYINFIQPGGHTGGLSMQNLSKWMDEKQMGAEVLRTTPWGEIGFGRLSKELLDRMTPPLERFFKTMPKSELAQGAIERRILLFPVNDTKDVFNHPQLLARGFFKEITIGKQTDNLKIPGPFITATGSPLSPFKRAPTIGEHNLEVYGEIGLTAPDIDRLVKESII